ncbi:MAG: metallopeptidase family protein [Acidobacteria bacterium]|nr:MAG: metallopeptidase family protein [Acidobacteriota bacterium]
MFVQPGQQVRREARRPRRLGGAERDREHGGECDQIAFHGRGSSWRGAPPPVPRGAGRHPLSGKDRACRQVVVNKAVAERTPRRSRRACPKLGQGDRPRPGAATVSKPRVAQRNGAAARAPTGGLSPARRRRYREEARRVPGRRRRGAMSGERDRIESLLDRAAEARDEGDDARAEEAAREALDLIERGSGDASLRAEALLLLAEAAIDARRDEEAFARLDEAAETPEARAEAALLRARLHLLRWELPEAEAALGGCVGDPEIRAAALYERAILADLAGDVERADALYAEAARLDPESFREPVRMSDDEAREFLEEVLETLPETVREALDNVVIEIVPAPDPASDAGPDTDPLLLGLYEGVPRPQQSVANGGTLPGRIRIFKRNIERMAAFTDRLREELRLTLLHEIGHHLGWDEEDLAQRGLE